MKRATENKFLIVKAGVVLTPRIERTIVALDKYFEEANHIAYVTSGLRNPAGQLDVIRGYLEKKGLKLDYKDTFLYDVNKKIEHDKFGSIYSWQLGWSKLLNLGVIINPPASAHVLMDYIRNGVNKKGLIIHGSPHFKGGSFDTGGGANGIADETAILQKALKAKDTGLINILPERENNANHCDVE